MRNFNPQDMQAIVAILENQPLQNLKAAAELAGLRDRFVQFATRAFSNESAQKEPSEGE